MKTLHIKLTECSSFHDSSILLTEDGKRLDVFTDMHEGELFEAMVKTFGRAMLMFARRAAREEIERDG